ncbi:MAG: hypothetical protein MZW92_71990 [Comamonadaceae bacterium]|nr:hypothetical protein [Comamonadaceae bacterium]
MPAASTAAARHAARSPDSAAIRAHSTPSCASGRRTVPASAPLQRPRCCAPAVAAAGRGRAARPPARAAAGRCRRRRARGAGAGARGRRGAGAGRRCASRSRPARSTRGCAWRRARAIEPYLPAGHAARGAAPASACAASRARRLERLPAGARCRCLAPGAGAARGRCRPARALAGRPPRRWPRSTGPPRRRRRSPTPTALLGRALARAAGRRRRPLRAADLQAAPVVRRRRHGARSSPAAPASGDRAPRARR